MRLFSQDLRQAPPQVVLQNTNHKILKRFQIQAQNIQHPSRDSPVAWQQVKSKSALYLFIRLWMRDEWTSTDSQRHNSQTGKSMFSPLYGRLSWKTLWHVAGGKTAGVNNQIKTGRWLPLRFAGTLEQSRVTVTPALCWGEEAADGGLSKPSACQQYQI